VLCESQTFGPGDECLIRKVEPAENSTYSPSSISQCLL
jgi:hypothetical protein